MLSSREPSAWRVGLVGLATLIVRRKDVAKPMPSRILPDDYRGPRSPDQAAAWLTVRGFAMSGSKVRRLIDDGSIKATRTKGGWVRIRQSELERYIRDNK